MDYNVLLVVKRNWILLLIKMKFRGKLKCKNCPLHFVLIYSTYLPSFMIFVWWRLFSVSRNKEVFFASYLNVEKFVWNFQILMNVCLVLVNVINAVKTYQEAIIVDARKDFHSTLTTGLVKVSLFFMSCFNLYAHNLTYFNFFLYRRSHTFSIEKKSSQ